MISEMKKLRFFKNLSLDEIYLLTGRKISQPRLSRIERGIAVPREEEKMLISKVLKEPVEKIFPMKNENEQEAI